jgi:hypothetical protein
VKYACDPDMVFAWPTGMSKLPSRCGGARDTYAQETCGVERPTPLETQTIDYIPGEERYAATGSTGGALIVARRCSNTARVSLRLSRRAASVMASKGYVTSERSNSRLDVATRRKGCAAKSIVESGHLAAD